MKKKLYIINAQTLRLVIICLLSAILLAGIFATRGAGYIALPILIFFLVGGILDLRFAVWSFIVFVFIPLSYIQRFLFNISHIYIFFTEFLLITAVLSNVIHNKKIIIRKNLFLVATGWFCIALVSAIVNEVNLLAIVINYRWLIYLLAGIYLFESFFDLKMKQKLLKLFVSIGLLNLPVILLQRYWVFKDASIWSADRACGLFSSYTHLVFFQIFCVVLVLLYWVHKKRFFKAHPLILILSLISVLAFSNSRAAWFFLILIIVYILIKFKIIIKNFKLTLIVVASATIGIIVFGYIMTVTYPHRARRRFAHINPAYILEHQFGEDFWEPEGIYHPSRGFYLQRGEAIIYNINLIRKNFPNLIFGMGPGSGERSRIPGLSGRIYEKYGKSNYLARTIVIKNILELGLSGVIIWLLLLFSLYKSNLYGDKNLANRRVHKVTIVLLFLLSFYALILEEMVLVITLSVLLINKESSLQNKNKQIERKYS